MRINIRTISLGVAVISAACATYFGFLKYEENSSGVSGWEQYRFGMSREEARKASDGLATANEYGLLELPAHIDGQNFTARLKFSGDGAKLFLIVLNSSESRELSPEVCRASYDKLIGAITKKYGRATLPEKITTYERIKAKTYSTMWVFENRNSINVRCGIGPDIGCDLNVDYSAAPPKTEHGF